MKTPQDPPEHAEEINFASLLREWNNLIDCMCLSPNFKKHPAGVDEVASFQKGETSYEIVRRRMKPTSSSVKSTPEAAPPAKGIPIEPHYVWIRMKLADPKNDKASGEVRTDHQSDGSTSINIGTKWKHILEIRRAAEGHMTIFENNQLVASIPPDGEGEFPKLMALLPSLKAHAAEFSRWLESPALPSLPPKLPTAPSPSFQLELPSPDAMPVIWGIHEPPLREQVTILTMPPFMGQERAESAPIVHRSPVPRVIHAFREALRTLIREMRNK